MQSAWPTNPAAAIVSTYSPMRPTCPPRSTTTTPTPWRARQAHGGLGRELRGELAPAAPAVDPGDGAALEYDRGLGGRIHLAALDELDIRRQAQHAVRVVTGDVGLDERARDHLRALRRRAGRGENRRGEDDEIGCWEEEIVKHQKLTETVNRFC